MVTKAIIPVAGLGTRFLPAAKSQPKEMLPIVDKPIIHYIVEEAVKSGIKDIIFITSQTKRALEDYFDSNFELEFALKNKKRKTDLKEIRAITKMANFVYIRQTEPKGCGDAVLRARNLVKNEPCAVLWGDDIIDSKTPALQQLIKVYQKYGDPVVAVTPMPKRKISAYGVIKPVKIEKNIYQAVDFIEKPAPEKAPSNLAIVGRYVITPDVMEKLARLKPAADGEIRLIDAFKALLPQKPVYACQFQGTWYSCGDKLGFLKATVNYGLKHKKIGREFRKYLSSTNYKF